MSNDALSLADIARIEPIRAALASGDAVAVLTPDLDRVLASNMPMARLFGHRDSEGFRTAGLVASPTAKRQLMQAVTALDHFGGVQNAMIRIASGLRSRLVPARIERIVLASGENAIAVACAGGGFNRPATEIARDIVAEYGNEAAIGFVDANGALVAASARLTALAPTEESFARLQTLTPGDGSGQGDGVVESGAGRHRARLYRFAEEPALHLVIVDEMPMAEELVRDPASEAVEPPDGAPASPFSGRFTVRRPSLAGEARQRAGIPRPYFRAAVLAAGPEHKSEAPAVLATEVPPAGTDFGGSLASGADGARGSAIRKDRDFSTDAHEEEPMHRTSDATGGDISTDTGTLLAEGSEVPGTEGNRPDAGTLDTGESEAEAPAESEAADLAHGTNGFEADRHAPAERVRDPSAAVTSAVDKVPASPSDGSASVRTDAAPPPDMTLPVAHSVPNASGAQPPRLNAWSLGRMAQTMTPPPVGERQDRRGDNDVGSPRGEQAEHDEPTRTAHIDIDYLADPATDLARWRAEIAETESEPDLPDNPQGADAHGTPSPGHAGASDEGRSDGPDPVPADTGTAAEAADMGDPDITAAGASPAGSESPLSGPVRFVWKMDRDTRFTEVSPAFAQAVGPNAADLIGRTFRDVATVFALDPGGSISALLERRDTWSGKTVLWPIQGTDLRVPVDLAALPTYGRERNFEGYRGFGVVRLNDAIVDPEELGLSLVGGVPAQDTPQPAPAGGPEEDQRDSAATTGDVEGAADPFEGEPPAMNVTPIPMRRASDKVISLSDRRPRRVAGAELTDAEQAAFRSIGEALGQGSEEQEFPPSDDESEASAGTPVQPDEAVPFARDMPSGPAVPAGEDMAAAGDDLPVTAETGPAGAGGVDTTILSRLPIALLIHSGETLHYANPEFLSLTGYPDLDSLVSAGGLDALFAEPATNGQPDEPRRLTLVRADDEFVAVQAHLQRVRWRRGHALLTSLRPFATPPRMRGESTVRDDETLKERIAELTNILDTATDGVVLINPDGTIRSLNQSAAALFDYDPSDIQSKSFSVLFAHESQRAAMDYLAGLSHHGVASVLNEGREVLGRESGGGFIPLFMTIGRLGSSGGYCAVLRDITHWKQTEQALTDARREAEAASHQKSDFLARISHEIRTPLNSIIGFSELMAEERFGPIGNERYRDYLNDINRSGRHVLDLVNDLLDISKIEAGKQDLEFEAVSLNDALLEAVSLMQPQANRERVIIRSSFASRLPAVVADQRSIKQIALNVLSNAVRFTPAGGQVIVSTVYEASGDVVLRIRDTGIGMSQKEIETAMKPFRQVSTLGAKRGDGTGLGLPLTKALVEANRADFAIASVPGKGTTIEITFPSTRVLAD